MRSLALVPLTFALLAAGGCVTAGDGEAMRADIRQLKADLQEERAANKQAREKTDAELAAKMVELKTAVDGLNRAARKSGADLGVDVEKAQNDIAALRGQIEVLQHRQDALEQASGEQRKAQDEAAKTAAARRAEPEAPADSASLYALAKRKLDAGDTGGARALFGSFLAKYRSDELAPSAQYWLGESYFQEEKYNAAIVEFEKVRKGWRSSDKVPDALLKIGLSFQASGDCTNASLFFDEVSASYKGSPAARKAAQKKSECRKGKGGKPKARAR